LPRAISNYCDPKKRQSSSVIGIGMWQVKITDLLHFRFFTTEKNESDQKKTKYKERDYLLL
jgi:hypothetical protein